MLRGILVAAARTVPSGGGDRVALLLGGDEAVAAISPSTKLRRSSARCGLADRIVIGRRLGQDGEKGRFRQRQLADILVEIGAAAACTP